jgi:hypothetical protein
MNLVREEEIVEQTEDFQDSQLHLCGANSLFQGFRNLRSAS